MGLFHHHTILLLTVLVAGGTRNVSASSTNQPPLTTSVLSKNRIVSKSSTRLPMSLSLVVNDLEAEGADRVVTAAFITSPGVSAKRRREILPDLFGFDRDDDLSEECDDDEDLDSAVAAKFGGEDGDTSSDSEDDEDITQHRSSGGIAVAMIPSDASANRISSTVHACGDTVVYIVTRDELLNNNNGSFKLRSSALAPLVPALEGMLRRRNEENEEQADLGEENGENFNSQQPLKRILVVAIDDPNGEGGVVDVNDEGALDQELRQCLNSAAADMLAAVARPLGGVSKNESNDAGALGLAFDEIVAIPVSDANGEPIRIDTILRNGGTSKTSSTAASGVPGASSWGRDPASAAATVAAAVPNDEAGMAATSARGTGARLLSSGTVLDDAGDLVAVRTLGRIAAETERKCLYSVKLRCMGYQDDEGVYESLDDPEDLLPNPEGLNGVVEGLGENGLLIEDYGELCAAAMGVALDEYDAHPACRGIASSNSKNSPLVRQVRSDLIRNLRSELSIGLNAESQIQLLRQTYIERFESEMRKLRLTPALPQDLERLANDNTKGFTKALTGMVVKMPRSLRGNQGSSDGASETQSNSAHASSFRKEVRDKTASMLLRARASGKWLPVPRKGVSVGLHWLFPRPFGNDVRSEPWEVRGRNDMVFVPEDGLTDVSKDEIRKGDWRDAVVPAPMAPYLMHRE